MWPTGQFESAHAHTFNSDTKSTIQALRSKPEIYEYRVEMPILLYIGSCIKTLCAIYTYIQSLVAHTCTCSASIITYQLLYCDIMYTCIVNPIYNISQFQYYGSTVLSLHVVWIIVCVAEKEHEADSSSQEQRRHSQTNLRS